MANPSSRCRGRLPGEPRARSKCVHGAVLMSAKLAESELQLPLTSSPPAPAAPPTEAGWVAGLHLSFTRTHCIFLSHCVRAQQGARTALRSLPNLRKWISRCPPIAVNRELIFFKRSALCLFAVWVLLIRIIVVFYTLFNSHSTFNAPCR